MYYNNFQVILTVMCNSFFIYFSKYISSIMKNKSIKSIIIKNEYVLSVINILKKIR